MDLQERKEELAWACRILHMNGQTDMTLGHISSRIPGTDTFLMKPKGLGFDEVTPADIQVLDMTGRKVSGPHAVHTELPIHINIYKARPDVNCVHHAHPLNAIPLGASDNPLAAVSHDGIFFIDNLRVYDGSPELVLKIGHGDELVEALGNGHVLLLRNHGTVIAHKDVRWSVITAVVLERAVDLYLRTRLLGNFKTMDPDVARRMMHTKHSDRLMAEYWDYYVRRAIRAGHAQGMPTPRPVWDPNGPPF